DQSYMLNQFMEWSQDPDEHVRRLVSEGSRPLLPWGQKLPQFSENPELTWPLLVALKNDTSKYVQKSVANHMNDLSKNNGDWLVQNLKNWPNPWVVKHATRTLIKKGHSGALQLSGVSSVQPQIIKITLNIKKIKLGDSLKGSLILKNPTKKNMTVVVDVCLDLLKSNGKYSKKVFKGKRILLPPNSQLQTVLNTPLKKVTTRVYYKGHQYWSLMINGQNSPLQKFTLD
nr:hypothetical protein [Pseudobdellovibrionaceae bacterium]